MAKKRFVLFIILWFVFALSEDTRSLAAVAGTLLPLLALSQGPWPESCGGLFVIRALS